MKLGQRVKFKNIVSFDYNEHNIKCVNKISTNKCYCGNEGIIIRKTRKATGVYHRSYGGRGMTIDGYDEFEPAYLDVKEWYIVYEIAYNINNKPVLVLPEDIQSIED